MSHHFVLIGHPVGHSVSPAIHAAAYRDLGADADYRLADCPQPEDVHAVVESIRSGEIQGANVTVPWKQLAFDEADEHARTALDVGVANVLARSDDGRVVAHNTDASALGQELHATASEGQLDIEAQPAALVLGSGGAAAAAVVACKLAGAKEIHVSARRYDPSVSDWPRRQQFEALGARLLPWPQFDPTAWDAVTARCGFVVQATSAGMKGTSGGTELAVLVPWQQLRRAVAYDLVYNPPSTPFLQEARRAGLAARGGLGMLVGQAADAIDIWLRHKPDPERLMPVAREALGL